MPLRQNATRSARRPRQLACAPAPRSAPRRRCAACPSLRIRAKLQQADLFELFVLNAFVFVRCVLLVAFACLCVTRTGRKEKKTKKIRFKAIGERKRKKKPTEIHKNFKQIELLSFCKQSATYIGVGHRDLACLSQAKSANKPAMSSNVTF